ncbi:GIY-YIG nuclease family protein [Alloactinosynnema sp. L-07]|uniref:GIY-YIG nuclease family protein n=1 Tax=Alloactinosynnema sp. L-07 TaxID=1653480 RepID=UPI0006B64DFC|nr:GIY-YIG nuclease family protein [Alloactinosynnema sp. L-07]
MLQFDNGVIKAGMTADLATRSNEHAKDAGRFDLTIVNRWSSEAQPRVHQLERRLLAVLSMMGTRTPAGREYFRDIPFTIARHQAINLHHTSRAQCCCGNCVDPIDIRRMQATVISDPDISGSHDFTEYKLELGCGSRIRTAISDPDFAPDSAYALRPDDDIEIDIDCRPWNRVWTTYVAQLPTRLT